MRIVLAIVVLVLGGCCSEEARQDAWQDGYENGAEAVANCVSNLAEANPRASAKYLADQCRP